MHTNGHIGTDRTRLRRQIAVLRDTVLACAIITTSLLVPTAEAATASQAATVPTDWRAASDIRASHAGGIAARIRDASGAPLPGTVFMLMATPGSTEPARVYDETPFVHHNALAPDLLESNDTAATLVETLTGHDIDVVEFTSAPGGGPSAGLTYAIAYLNLVSDGAFTGAVRVAATGSLAELGYVGPITGINEKAAAGHLADVDVLFTPTAPAAAHVDRYGSRHVGELSRARNTGATLDDERRLANYEGWGAHHPVGMDIIGVRHIADVAAYLCGTGSDFACVISDGLGRLVTSTSAVPDGVGNVAREVAPSATRAGTYN